MSNYPWDPNNTSTNISEQSKATYQNYQKTKEFEDVGYFLQSYVVTGGEVTKNITRNNTIDAAAVTVSLNNNIMSRDGMSFESSVPMTIYYLDFTKDGDWSWGTAHAVGTAGSDYLAIALVTTDGHKNVTSIIDNRGIIGGFRLKSTYGLEDYVTNEEFEILNEEVENARYDDVNEIEYDSLGDRLNASDAEIKDLIHKVRPWTWNIEGGLRNWNVAKAKAKNSIIPVVAIGDSITASAGGDGWDTGFVNLWKNAIQLENGFAGYGFKSLDIFYGRTGWTQLNEGTNIMCFQGSTSADIINFDMSFNGFDIIYTTKPDGGTINISVDGSPNNINCTGTLSHGNVFHKDFSLQTYKHGITINAPVGGNAYIEGFVFYSANGVIVQQIGHPGIRAVDYGYDQELRTLSINRFNPQLTIVALGTNDCGTQIGLTEYKNSLDLLVKEGLKTGDVLVMMQGDRQDGDSLPIKYSDYVDAAFQVAKDNNCAFLSIYDRWNRSYIWGGNRGLYSDNVHPSQYGHSDIAEALRSELGGFYANGLVQTPNVTPYYYGVVNIDNRITIPMTFDKSMSWNNVDVSVTLGATSMSISLANTTIDGNYGVRVTPNWNTTCWVTSKGYSAFVVNFGTAAPAGAKIDWYMQRG